ncbi:MAG: flavodoxin family protein [Clostridia bacterium]|nr:flavodoxin family protein [Clostridia bacterium]
MILILNGSPRKHGDTAVMIEKLVARLNTEVIVVDCFSKSISPCIDCRYCVSHSGCAVMDDMQEIYKLIENSDGIVLASPVYFGLPTPPLASVASRMQTRFCARFFRHEVLPQSTKKGGILLCGGGLGSASPAEDAMKRFLRGMGVKDIGPVVSSLHTDTVPTAEDPTLDEQIDALVAYLLSD